MTLGAGKYDDLCTQARESTGADAVVLIVLGGSHGSGFSAQLVATGVDAPVMTMQIANLLRAVADSMDTDARAPSPDPADAKRVAALVTVAAVGLTGLAPPERLQTIARLTMNAREAQDPLRLRACLELLRAEVVKMDNLLCRLAAGKL